ncbi:FxLYD domain-containing protein [Streptomyces sp. NPDC059718]
MTRPYRSRAVCAAVVLSAVAFTASACSDNDSTPAEKASKAASAASSLVSEGAEAVASATAAAQSQLAKIKNGVNAKDDVKLDPVTVEGGKATTKVTATNSGDKQATYTVEVTFRDASGNLLDAAVVNVADVAPQKSGEATVRSNRDLTGTVKAQVERALRH